MPSSPSSSNSRKRRTLLGYGILMLIALSLVAWRQVFIIQDVRIMTSADVLPPDGRSEAEIRLVPVGGFGWAVPFTDLPFTAEFDEGASLVRLRQSEDDTAVILTAGVEPGTVTLRLRSTKFPFPFLVRIRIETPMA